MFSFSFWRDATEEDSELFNFKDHRIAILTTICLAVLTVIAGVYPEPFIQVSDRVATELLVPKNYVDAVFVPIAEGVN